MQYICFLPASLDGAVMETMRPAKVVQLMTVCPDGWPLEIVSRGETAQCSCKFAEV